MRLGQLARKLGLSYSEVVQFLSQQNIQIGEGSNTKLTEEQVRQVVQHLAPAMIDEIFSSAEKIQDAPVAVTHEVIESADDTQPVINDHPVIEENPVETMVQPTAEVPDASTLEIMNAEVIKAPKVELPGLKVLGKIELPQPKKKDPEVQPVEEGTTTPPEVHEKPRYEDRKNLKRNDRREREQRPRKNPIAAQREREALEAQRKKEEEALKEKDRKTQYYLQRVKTVPTKAAKLYDEPVEQLDTKHQAEQPKTWLGRFWKWYRS